MGRRFLLAFLALSISLGALALSGNSAEPPGEGRIRQLIDQLGSANFEDREKATQALEEIGAPALELLRQAAKSEDAEVRRRAGELVPKIEKRVEEANRRTQSAKLLAPKRVHLVFKDTPVAQAVEEVRKKTGYEVVLADPDNKLKERTVTLDTRETPFWEALDLFCRKAGLVEAPPERLGGGRLGAPVPPAGPRNAPPDKELAKTPAPPPVVEAPPPLPALPGGPAAAPVPVVAPAFRLGGALQPPPATPITLVDGKARALPSDYHTAIRVRALPGSELFGPAPEGETLLVLQFSLEPRMNWSSLTSIKVEKARNDKGQELSDATAPTLDPLSGPVARPGLARGYPSLPGGTHQYRPVRLKKGEKEARSLKEFQGSLRATVVTEARPFITIDNILKAGGKTFKGPEGSSIKVVRAERDDAGQVRVEYELEKPPDFLPAGRVMGMTPMRAGVGGAGAGVGARPGVIGAPVGRGGMANTVSGMTLEDDKGTSFAVKSTAVRARMTEDLVIEVFTLVFQPDKGQGEPTRLIYSGSKLLPVEIPFTLKDIPLGGDMP